MRELKFRFWSPKTKCIYADTGLSSLGVNNAIEKANEVGYIFMQYTGLKDKNGKEIYEGDIVVPVEMHDENIDFWSNGKGIPRAIKIGLWGNNCPYDLSNWEVIGNIYENPELLKESR